MRKTLFVTLVFFILSAQASSFVDGLNLYDQKNYSGAFKIWQQHANEGLVNAQHNIGVMLDKGLGVQQDKAKAIIWFKKAAAQGHSKSQYTLGSRYFSGKYGVEKDYSKAIYWWEKAVNKGSSSVKYNLGILYLYADENFLDHEKARKWLKLAANEGHLNAKLELSKLELQLTTIENKTRPKSSNNNIGKQLISSTIKQEEVIKLEPKDNTTKSTTKTAKINNFKTDNEKEKSPKVKNETPIIRFKDTQSNNAKTKSPTKVSNLDPGFKIVISGTKTESKPSNKAKPEVKKKPNIKPEKYLVNNEKITSKPNVTKLKKAKPAKKPDWITAQSSSRYTIQLAVAGGLKEAKGFILKHKLGNKAHVYKIKNKKLYKIITGSYSNINNAQRAIRKLPSKLRKLGIWPKKFSVVHKEKGK